MVPDGSPAATCAELLTVPIGNDCTIWAELETTPPVNAVVGILPLRINIPGTLVLLDIESQTKSESVNSYKYHF